MSSIDQQFVEFIIKSLVSNPDAVSIKRTIDEKGVLLELTVDPEDLGRVIGKRGATAQSVRTLLRALGTKNDARYNLKIVDNSDPSSRPPRPVDTAKDDSATQTKDPDVAADDPVADQSTVDDEPDEKALSSDENRDEDTQTSSVVSKTRKELEELDDLDV